MCLCTWAIGLPRSLEPMPRRFRRTVVVFHRHRCPHLAMREHPLVSFALLQSSFELSSARALARPCASPGVSSLFATSARGVHCSPGFPSPTVFRPQRFARSRRLAPPRASRVCFAALPCPGFRFRGCLLRPGRTTSSVAVTLAPLVTLACRLPGASERHVDLRVLLQTGVRCERRAC